ncbi:MAG: ABC transporter ATP-binding protein [Methanoregulaceae archaeon]
MIEARDIVKRYNGFTALDGVSFEFGDAGIFGIIGHNGAGKTTLLKIISGLISPSSGSLSVNGIDVVRDPISLKQMLGYLPEESRLYDTMTVDGYLTFFGELYGLSRADIQTRSRELLGALSLDAPGKKLGELSKGMRRKVAIARSLIHNPSLLVYDEATSGLDPMTSRFITDYLRTLRDEQKTIVISAHNLYQVEAICDQVMILRRGKVVALGNMHELREMFGSISYSIFFTIADPNRTDIPVPYTLADGICRADARNIDELNAYTRSITSAGGAVERIESHYPSLEEMLVKIGQ